jgi:hypothetical protein
MSLEAALGLGNTLAQFIGVDFAHGDAVDSGIVPLASGHVFDELGRDPVGVTHGGKTAVEDGFATQADGTRKVDLSAEKVAGVDGMTDNEKKAYFEALKHPETMTETTVGEAGLNGKNIVMGDGSNGGYGAKEGTVNLDPDTKVRIGTYRYEDEDGNIREETFYIFDKCSNPAVDAAQDEIVPPVATPPTDCCVPGERSVTPEELKGSRAHPENTVTAAVVTEKVEDVDDVWTDKNGDGNMWHIEHTARGDVYCFDEGEINADALPGRDQIAADIAEYQKTHDGKMPEHLWYTFTDCDGKSVVLCYNLEAKHWGVLKDMTWTPEGQDAISGPAIDTKDELDAYLTKERVGAK